MSLTSALSSALTGLQVSSRRAQVVSQNVANAGRDGYGARELEVTPISPKIPGLRTSIVRTEDAAAMSLRREAHGQATMAGDAAGLWGGVERVLGVPGDAEGLAGRVAAFEARLIEASSNPSSTVSLDAVRDAAARIVDTFNDASGSIRAARQGAEDGIVAEVDALNDSLATIAELNGQIAKQGAIGGDTAALEDQRSLAIDRVASSVRVEILQRDFGAVAIVSHDGQILLDGRPAEITFAPAVQVTPDRTVGAGLGTIEVNGRPVSTDGGPGSLGGGRLAGLFEARDIAGPEAQDGLDALAEEFIARFSAPGADPTLAPGDPGLFTAAGTGPGTASRLSLNPLVAASGANETWRIRDGLGAAAPAPTASVGNLNAHLFTMQDRQAPADPILGTAPRDITGLVLAATSEVSASAGRYRDIQDRATIRLAAAQEQVAASGVDIDEQMRRLIEIEQSYAAAARVTEAVGDMMDRLTRI